MKLNEDQIDVLLRRTADAMHLVGVHVLYGWMLHRTMEDQMTHLIGYALFGIIVFCFSLYLLHLRKQLEDKSETE